METRHGTRVFSVDLSQAEAQWRVTSTTGSGPLSQDSDFDLRAKAHPSKSFKVRPEPNPEQHAEEDGGDTKNGSGRKNYFAFSLWKELFKFEGGGPWLEKAGGPLVIGLVVVVMALAVAGIAWKAGWL